MNNQRFTRFSILALTFVVIGCTSSAPDADDSANAVVTSKAARKVDDRLETTLLTLQSSSSSGEKFVNSMRRWKDNENAHSTNAELVSVSIKNRTVKLLKENGVTVDVSIDRLSQHDRNFLTQAVHALRDQLVNEE